MNTDEKSYYDRRWGETNYLVRNDIERFQRILDYFMETGLKEPTVLDFGCGTGWVGGFFSNFSEVQGIDLSTEGIKKAQISFPRARFVSGDLFQHSFEEATFDIVISNEVFEHVNSQPEYIRLAYKYLRTNGYLILSTPNRPVAEIYSEELIRSGVDPGLQPIESWVSASELVDLLEPCFKIIKLDSYIFGRGHSGMKLRVFNSPKINTVVNGLRLNHLYEKMGGKLMLGSHISVLCQKLK